ncbi:MAG: zinc ribbon domain-containing protein [Nitrososphaeria archaeon]
MVKKKCPLCGKVYEYENISVCPLFHCPSCGDAPVKRIIRFENKIEEVTEGIIYLHYFLLALSLFYFILFLYGISPLLFSGNILEMSDLHTALAITGLVLFSVLMIFSKIPFIECARCHYKFRIPRKNIPLQALEQLIKRCGKCGAEMPVDAMFCGKCGSKL